MNLLLFAALGLALLLLWVGFYHIILWLTESREEDEDS